MKSLQYSIHFQDRVVGNIFQMGDRIYLCSGNLTVAVPASEYHRRMRAWIESRAQRPLIFEANGTRCQLSPTPGGGEVQVQLIKTV